MVPLREPSSIQAFEGVETSLRRFENEAQIAAALSRKSRHIAQVIDYGIDDGTAYLVMELPKATASTRSSATDAPSTPRTWAPSSLRSPKVSASRTATA